MTEFKPGDTVHIEKNAVIERTTLAAPGDDELFVLSDGTRVAPARWAENGWEVTVYQDPYETFEPGDIVVQVRDIDTVELRASARSTEDCKFILSPDGGYALVTPGGNVDVYTPHTLRARLGFTSEFYEKVA